jgi:hypothetical protein
MNIKNVDVLEQGLSDIELAIYKLDLLCDRVNHSNGFEDRAYGFLEEIYCSLKQAYEATYMAFDYETKGMSIVSDNEESEEKNEQRTEQKTA